MSQIENLRALGEEKINKLMLKFSIPCILSLLVSSLYNIVDQIFIGNSSLSTLGNAATSVVFPVFVIAQAFAWCFGDGCAAYLNICQGKNDAEGAPKAIGASITVAFLSGCAMMAVFYPLGEPILRVFGASSETMAYSLEYLHVILATIPIFILCNMMNSVVRADGSPAWAMISMLAGAITNIILDPVFIFALDMGMTGAALATVIGQCTTFLMTLAYFFRTKTFKLTPDSFIPRLSGLLAVIKLGFSTFTTQFAIVVVTILCNVQLAKYGALSKFGEDIPIAIIGIQSKIFTVVINLVVGIVLGCQPVISFNMGARKYGRVRELYRKIMGLAIIIGLSFTVLFELAPSFVIGLFGEPTNVPNPLDYWEFGEKTMRIFLSLISISCLVKTNSIFFQAVGKPIHATFASTVRDLFCFVPLIIVLPAAFSGVESILYAAPISDLIALIVTAFLSISFLRSLRNTASLPSEQAVIKPSLPSEQAVIKPSRPGVIITVSREHGSSGKQIGKMVAERLGIPFYYKEMMALAAEESGLDKEFIEQINENSPTILQSAYLSADHVQHALTAQDRMIRRIADMGSCVIVGRAADYVLRDYENVLRVFVYAPKDFRIGRIMEIYGDSCEDAKKEIRRSDEARASYYKQISGKDWDDKDNYDLIINSSHGLEKSAATICAYVQGLGETHGK